MTRRRGSVGTASNIEVNWRKRYEREQEQAAKDKKRRSRDAREALKNAGDGGTEVRDGREFKVTLLPEVVPQHHRQRKK